MASTKRLDLMVTSGKSYQAIVELATSRANSRDNSDKNKNEDDNKIYAHYYDITYFRDSKTIAEQKEDDNNPDYTYPIAGDKHMVYSDDVLEKMPTLKRSEDILMKSEFLRGYTDEVVIDSVDGTVVIEHDSLPTDYNVLLQVKDDLGAIARVEAEENTSFKIVLYDAEAYAEDKVKLDCSIENITINYNVIYE